MIPACRCSIPNVALTAVSVLKGVLTNGTARQALSAISRSRPPARPARRRDNTNSWFVGSTPQLTTAVWVGDPDGYTPMVCGVRVNGVNTCNTQEFVDADGIREVQGGTYPARIWACVHAASRRPVAFGGLGPAACAGTQGRTSVPAGQRVSRQAGQRRAARWQHDDVDHHVAS